MNSPQQRLTTTTLEQVVMRCGRKLELREYGDRDGHPVFFFHGLIGSHYQASYIAHEAKRAGLRIIAPNRPGVGISEFTARRSPLEAVSDVEDVAQALGLDEFSVIGISGGTPYALAVLARLRDRVKAATIISGMGPMSLRGALEGMDRRRRIILEVGSRFPQLALAAFQKAAAHFQQSPTGLLDSLIRTWATADQEVFSRKEIYDLFMNDLRQVFTDGNGAIGLAHELGLYRYRGLALGDLPRDKCITIWHGLDDVIVPPAMACKLACSLPKSEAHLVAGGHFVAVDIAPEIIGRLRRQLSDRSI